MYSFACGAELKIVLTRATFLPVDGYKLSDLICDAADDPGQGDQSLPSYGEAFRYGSIQLFCEAAQFFFMSSLLSLSARLIICCTCDGLSQIFGHRRMRTSPVTKTIRSSFSHILSRSEIFAATCHQQGCCNVMIVLK